MRAVGQGRKGKSMFGIGIWNLPGSDLVPTLEWQLNKRATEGLSRVEISEVPESYNRIWCLGSHPFKCCLGTTAKRSDLIVYGCRARLAASAGVC